MEDNRNTASPGRRKPKPHPARRSRRLTGAASAVTALAMVGVMTNQAAASGSASTDATPSAQAAATNSTDMVVVVTRNLDGTISYQMVPRSALDLGAVPSTSGSTSSSSSAPSTSRAFTSSHGS
ncbi:MAG: hypothetical protein WAN34_10035 [Acidimicrobiia bacterium]